MSGTQLNGDFKKCSQLCFTRPALNFPATDHHQQSHNILVSTKLHSTVVSQKWNCQKSKLWPLNHESDTLTITISYWSICILTCNK